MNFFKRHLNLIAVLAAFGFANASGTFLLSIQAVAWVKMTSQFLKHDAPKIALRKTFDGKHPCELCLHLQEMRAKQSSSSSTPVHASAASESLGLARETPPRTLAVSPPEFVRPAWAVTEWVPQSQFQSPPTPPPKLTGFVS